LQNTFDVDFDSRQDIDIDCEPEDDDHKQGVKYLIKMRLNVNSLLFQVANEESRLNLKFQPT